MQLAGLLVLGVHEPLEVVEREFRVHRHELVHADDGVHALAAAEGVLERKRVRRQPVGKEIAEQELTEPPSRLRRPQDLLKLSQVLRLLGQLRGRAANVAELLVDRVRLLRGVLHAPVDLRIEVG